MMTRPTAVSFSGGGHLLMYHLGVAHQLKRSSVRVNRWVGSSGGAVAAAVAAATGADGVHEFATKHASRCRSLTGLADFLPRDAHEGGTHGDLAISVTECRTGANRLLGAFPTRGALLSAVGASCHIPRSFHPLDFIGADPIRRPRAYPEEEGVELAWAQTQGFFVDGGLSANVPSVDNHRTMRVSVFSTPEADTLAPSDVGGAQGSLGELPVPFNVRLPGTLDMSGLRLWLSLPNLRRAVVAAAGAPRPVMLQLFREGARDCAAYIESNTFEYEYS